MYAKMINHLISVYSNNVKPRFEFVKRGRYNLHSSSFMLIFYNYFTAIFLNSANSASVKSWSANE